MPTFSLARFKLLLQELWNGKHPVAGSIITALLAMILSLAFGGFWRAMHGPRPTLALFISFLLLLNLTSFAVDPRRRKRPVPVLIVVVVMVAAMVLVDRYWFPLFPDHLK